MWSHGLAELSQMRVGALPTQQCTPQFLLQLLHGAGKRRLGHVAGLGRAGEIQGVGEGKKVAYLMHFHGDALPPPVA